MAADRLANRGSSDLDGGVRGQAGAAPEAGRAGSPLPRRLRVAHLIVFPALGMGGTILLFRLLDRYIVPVLPPLEAEIYGAIRPVLIAILMSSLVGYLAFRYRTGFEAELEARNEDLEATRDFLQQIIGGSGEAIITRDIEGRVTSWNPAAEEIYGWSAAEMLGRGIDCVVPDDPETREALRSVEAAAATGETVRDFEARRIRKDGKTISVDITISPIHDRAGQRLGSIGIVRDVTSLKEMETRLVERETLAAVGEMAAILAHEVRNPLAGIRGGCEILLEGYTPEDPRAEIGREVIHQVDRLNRTVHDLLLFARPRAMDPVPVDLHALLDRLLAVLREDPANRTVEVRRDYGNEVPVVRVDGRQMEQVFLNLLLNACQAMGQKGTIVLSTTTNVETVEISVRDFGPGIPADKIEQIFRPFFTTRTHGTGLGLAICRKIVDAHGGRITAESLADGGARFTVILPRAA